ncbi:coiled-coil domain containing 169 isoform X2 [Cyprinodon tularosa]|uniref:coiled-coil domain containing 169 isoform X2 n=1 Tax=Cyprinodon tularosa TaxID=77115 RepID=UPI0018E20F71|nr:coiled-coil domain containing 169 isoform X2 [Cyprinodon tularosa]
MAKGNDYSKDDMARLQEEFREEVEIREMLIDSVSDLRYTVAEMQARLHNVDGEENEWKTRFETQVELNGQLEKQITHVQQRLESIKGNPVDRLAFIRSYEGMTVEMLRQHLMVLTEEKSELQKQLRDCYLQIEQEGKLSSVQKLQRRQYSNQRQVAPEIKQIRAQREKHIRRKVQAASDNRTEEGLIERVNGGGGGCDSTMEREMKKKHLRESKLPTLKHRQTKDP